MSISLSLLLPVLALGACAAGPVALRSGPPTVLQSSFAPKFSPITRLQQCRMPSAMPLHAAIKVQNAVEHRPVTAVTETNHRSPSTAQRDSISSEGRTTPIAQEWSVHKFGGTSLADAACYRQVADIISTDPRRLVVVVSAQGKLKDESGKTVYDKVTSLLIECARLAAAQDPTCEVVLQEIIERNIETAKELLGESEEQVNVVKQLLADADDLKNVLKFAWLSRSVETKSCPWWTGYGEIWSARLLAAYLQQTASRRSVQWVDARDVINVSTRRPGQVVPLLDRSRDNWQSWLQAHPDCDLAVVTGFICSTDNGAPYTLGRDGSDHSASIMAALVDADELTIWSDVDGVYSADPNIVKGAVIRSTVSYQEAMELAYFGAKVLHPKTMTPLIGTDIPIRIRNTFKPESPGSVILPNRIDDPPRIQGFSTVENLMLINVEGCGMAGVPGIASRLFGAMHELGCSVMFVTQAGSEHSICFALPMNEAAKAVEGLKKEFRDELETKEIQKIDTFGPCACLAAVGDDMRCRPGVAGSVLSALGEANINARAISQGASERNISIVINQRDVEEALNAVHEKFIELDTCGCCHENHCELDINDCDQENHREHRLPN